MSAIAVAVGEHTTIPSAINSPSTSIAMTDDAGPMIASTLRCNSCSIPARVSSTVSPSLAFSHRTGCCSTPPRSLIPAIPTLTALIAAMPISLPGPVTGSSVPIVSTPSARSLGTAEVTTPLVGGEESATVDPAGSVVTAVPASALLPPSSPPHAAVATTSAAAASNDSVDRAA